MSLDIEKIMLDLDAFFKANLNNKISSINLEKNDGVTLATLDPEAFVLWSQETVNKSYNPYVLIQIGNVSTQFSGPYVSEQYDIEVLMFLQDDYNRINSWIDVLRYWRAVKETASLAWDSIAKGMQADIVSLAPIEFRENQTSNPLKVFGVQISFTLT